MCVIVSNTAKNLSKVDNLLNLSLAHEISFAISYGVFNKLSDSSVIHALSTSVNLFLWCFVISSILLLILKKISPCDGDILIMSNLLILFNDLK